MGVRERGPEKKRRLPSSREPPGAKRPCPAACRLFRLTRPHSRRSATSVCGTSPSRSIFSLRTGLLPVGARTFYLLDSVRLALARPPNLESQYQRMRKPCQEKNAKYG